MESKSSASKSMEAVLKSRNLFKEIFDFFTRRELVAKMEMLGKGFRENMFKTHLKAYVEVEIIANQFGQFENLVSYITWFTRRLTSTPIIPHSFELCFNSYHLKE